MSTPTKTILTLLSTAGQEVTVGLTLGETLIPIGKALVQSIERIVKGDTTESYAVLLKVDADELDAIDKLSTDDLSAINAELNKLGIPGLPLPEPPGPPITQ